MALAGVSIGNRAREAEHLGGGSRTGSAASLADERSNKSLTLISGLLLHVRKDVRVALEREGDRGMPHRSDSTLGWTPARSSLVMCAWRKP